MTAVSVPCGICPSEIGLGATTCPGCGRELDEADKAVLQVRREGANHQAFARGKKVRSASKWIGALAILFAVSGPIMYAAQLMVADKALANLEPFEDEEELEPIDGKVYTAGELRAEVRGEPRQVLIGSLILAGLMAVLWVWSRRAPLPAIACALGLFIVVHVVSAIFDPSSILKGIIIKVLAFVALGKGLSAALATRSELGRPPA